MSQKLRNMNSFLTKNDITYLFHKKFKSLANVTNGIAHEINNPLAIISGYAQQLKSLCEETPIPVDRINLITNKIVGASDRCSRIIDSLKDFSRDGSFDEFKKESLGKVIDATVGLCKQRYASHGVVLKVEKSPSDLNISCRKTQLIQSLYNLLVNAFEVSKDVYRPMVSIKTAELQNSVAITVSDNGRGIPESIKNSIFEPFFTTKEIGHGVGVGLSIAKGVIEEHGGTLTQESTAGNTAFIITLPKCKTLQVRTKHRNKSIGQIRRQPALNFVNFHPYPLSIIFNLVF